MEKKTKTPLARLKYMRKYYSSKKWKEYYKAYVKKNREKYQEHARKAYAIKKAKKIGK